MTGRRKLLAMGFGLTLCLGLNVLGQDEVRHRVPPYFGQIGLSDEQREKIYKIQDKHAPAIDKLEAELKKARETELKDCEGVLTDAQKKELESKRKAGASKAKKAMSKGRAGANKSSEP